MRLEEVVGAIEGGYCRLQPPLVTVAGRWLGALEGWGGVQPIGSLGTCSAGHEAGGSYRWGRGGRAVQEKGVGRGGRRGHVGGQRAMRGGCVDASLWVHPHRADRPHIPKSP